MTDIRLNNMQLISSAIKTAEEQRRLLSRLASSVDSKYEPNSGDDTLQKGDEVEVIDHFFDAYYNVIEKGWTGIIVDRALPFIRVDFGHCVIGMDYERVRKFHG